MSTMDDLYRLKKFHFISSLVAESFTVFFNCLPFDSNEELWILSQYTDRLSCYLSDFPPRVDHFSRAATSDQSISPSSLSPSHPNNVSHSPILPILATPLDIRPA